MIMEILQTDLATKDVILTLNGGSSSIKFSLYAFDAFLQPVLKGKIAGIGGRNATFSFDGKGNIEGKKEEIGEQSMDTAGEFLIDWLEKNIGFEKVRAVGHRIVHGMNYKDAKEIGPELLAELKEISVYDPDHMPAEIFLIQKIQELKPQLKQVACFDTAFHADLPKVASQFALPRNFWEKGIKRYGFHGLSYSYLLEKLNETHGAEIAGGRLVLIHLGSGCSMAAVKGGKSQDTTMGFTPTGGLMMGTRSGDLDPGILDYLFKNNIIDTAGFSNLINHRSGLLGVSEISADMGDLLQEEHSDERAAEAIALFCYQAKKWIGAMASVLGGLDGLVFTGGIGENAPGIRLRICHGLAFLGVQVDELSNGSGQTVISVPESPVKVYLIPANEEYMIAKLTQQKMTAGLTKQ